ncbi:probable N-acetyltransferase CML1 isoform X1 [Sphaerodactylus townsendi]|uniref:probable N-acetyltransferase CML1 isoform X1 n=1 Tax=Sphaerodactylus townsendi TaxID=933632 RepID=UPI002025EC49|nr:probable N-acetyltransferase CML1 isoform X1 [Sphaerodactylus townsendi]XP_048365806.1 probable N-acetyltransferase CML1 isoform X1 [Sphaerodactylus townsendi]XP_048365807.1 probable N-acetyltransferase CML1 isoform X1 [Sphaerodactylus townsendi]XP_048365808.1 probable N-acetyltransferase CML1 isoform X1 [Sphaerodactylus townsendi]
MAEYHIRTFEDSDYEAVRAIFSDGIQEHAPAGCWHVLRCPQTHLLLLAVFLGAYGVSASFLFAWAVVAALLVMGWVRMKGLWKEYVQAALVTDMLDIRKTYLEPKDCCLWVATSGEIVVGMVAAVHPEDPSQWDKALELKRMSVAKGHRGRGLSKALTRTVICFAQERGYKAVILGTSMVQHAAQRVYEGMGFRRVRVFSPSLLAKLLQFYVYLYRYEIAGSR